jgi:small subunit ribosomal protein S18
MAIDKKKIAVKSISLLVPEKRKTCPFCSQNIRFIDYKDVRTLSRFLSPFMKIEPRRRSNLCAKHQRKIAQTLKRARHLALLPFTLR